MSEEYEHHARFVWFSNVPKIGEIFYCAGSLLSKYDYEIQCSINISDLIPTNARNLYFGCWPTIKDGTYNGEDFSFIDIHDLISHMYAIESKIL